MLDWHSIQATLFSLVRSDIEVFASSHKAEQFYGFYLDCNSYYGDVLPCLNTPDLLRRDAKLKKFDLTAKVGKMLRHELYADYSVDEIEERLRWSPGDWNYIQINQWDKWRQHWKPVCTLIENVRDDDESFEEQFMEMACRLLIQIEQSGVLNLLQLTPDFATMCADHDESDDASRSRLDRIRRQATAS